MMHSTRLSFSIPLGSSVLSVGLLFAGLMATSAQAQDWEIDWYSIDGGGTISSESSDSEWQLSGTIGQPDATASDELGGSTWSLTGGFWAIGPGEPAEDRLFSDRFEGAARSRP